MDIEEMKVEYHLAEDPKAQIRIIADQCLKKPWEIAAMLRNAGEDVDKRWFPKPQPKKKRSPNWRSAESPESQDLQQFIHMATVLADGYQSVAELKEETRQLKEENRQLRATLERMAEILLPLLKPQEEEET